jgi:DNA-binding transcriptional regulator YdaS (Cro superfamily)
VTTRHLNTFDAVLDAVGGFRALARLIGVSTPLTYRWRDEGRFPAYTLDAIERQLAPRGITVARAVFDFEPARAARKRQSEVQR